MNNIKENIVLVFFVGLFLGAISIFLATSGGPLNVFLFVTIFHFTMKQSPVYSIATVLFSQITKIISIVASTQYHMLDMKMIPTLIIVSIVDGYIGTVWNQKISSIKLENLYTVLMIATTAITCFNVIHSI